MTIQRLNFGTAAPNDGEFIITAFPKIDANFVDLYGLLSNNGTLPTVPPFALVVGASLGLGSIAVPASGTLLQGVAGANPVWTATPTLGVAGTTLGTLAFAGNTSGTTTLQPAAAASGVLTLPAATDTIVARNTTDALTNKTVNGLTITTTTGTLTIANGKTLTASNSLTLAGTDGKSLTLTNALTVTTNDGTLAFGAASKTFTVNNSLTLTGTDATVMTFPAASDTLAGLGTAQTFTKQNTFAAGTITTSQPLNITQTWNAAAVQFIGLQVIATDTASAASSDLLNLQNGGNFTFSVRKDGFVSIQNAAATITGGGLATFAAMLFSPDNAGDIGASGANRPRNLFLGGGITHGSATLLTTTTALTNNAAAQTATLTNGPTAGNPTKWIPINDNGTTRNIPAW